MKLPMCWSSWNGHSPRYRGPLCFSGMNEPTTSTMLAVSIMRRMARSSILLIFVCVNSVETFITNQASPFITNKTTAFISIKVFAPAARSQTAMIECPNVRIRAIHCDAVTTPLCPRPYQRRAVGLLLRASAFAHLGKLPSIYPYKGIYGEVGEVTLRSQALFVLLKVARMVVLRVSGTPSG